MDLDAILRRAVDLGATDVHLKEGQPPILRRDGSLEPLREVAPLTIIDLDAALNQVGKGAPARLQYFYNASDLDIASWSFDPTVAAGNATDAVKLTYKNNNAGLINLTPSTSYSCKTFGGELSPPRGCSRFAERCSSTGASRLTTAPRTRTRAKARSTCRARF